MRCKEEKNKKQMNKMTSEKKKLITIGGICFQNR